MESSVDKFRKRITGYFRSVFSLSRPSTPTPSSTPRAETPVPKFETVKVTKNKRKKRHNDDDDDYNDDDNDLYYDYPYLCHSFEKCDPKKRADATNEGSEAISYTPTDVYRPSCSKDAPRRTGPNERNPDDGGEVASIHYVKATAVRQLAAETGTIAILSSTASPSKQPAHPQRNQIPIDNDNDNDNVNANDNGNDNDDDDNENDVLGRIPLGVRERLDTEPVCITSSRTLLDDSDPDHLIPLPVIWASESDTDTRKLVFETVEKSTVCRTTADTHTSTIVTTENDVDSSNRRNNDGPISIWDPQTLPVFEKCKPPQKPRVFQKTKSKGHDEIPDGIEGSTSSSRQKEDTGIVEKQWKQMERSRVSEDRAEKVEFSSTAIGPVVISSTAKPSIENTNNGNEILRGGAISRQSTTDSKPQHEENDEKPIDLPSKIATSVATKTAAIMATTIQEPAVQQILDGDVAGPEESLQVAVRENSKGELPEEEFRLTMIQSVKEAVNKICEQAVEKTKAIVRSGFKRPDVSEISDYSGSNFSLPPAPTAEGQSSVIIDSVSTGHESSWLPPPPPSPGVEEEKNLASLELPDPPNDMDQNDSDLYISDEDLRVVGFPSDDDSVKMESGRWTK